MEQGNLTFTAKKAGFGGFDFGSQRVRMPLSQVK